MGVGESVFDYDGLSLTNIRRAVDVFVDEGRRNKVRFKTVVATEDPLRALEQADASLSNTEIDVTEHEDHYRVAVTKRIKRTDLEDGHRLVESDFALFQIGETDIWAAVTGHSPDQFEHGPLWVLGKSEPMLSTFFASSDDLAEILYQLKASFPAETEIQARKTVAYSRDEEGEISFKQRPFEEIFAVAADKGNYVDKMRFTVKTGDTIRLDAFLSRDGKLKFLGGDATRFFEDFLPIVAAVGQQKADLFGHKERSAETGELNELQIDFDTAHFKAPEDTEKLIRALDGLPNANLTVYHDNPYAHLSILDTIDGSSCDVFVTDSDTVSIVPSYRGSFNSLMRVAEQLSRELEEGEISEGTPEEQTMADFFPT
ncbi:hypothetical protein [Halosegnis marinus]|uniref:DUF4868 domain-containing protein n=1 Tax=Halosegnis marinus TaxID=3034023 RepID=A0ABD5ZSX5_9EURY|nr:hypothetical protein [Halosegnis sp. DT85]